MPLLFLYATSVTLAQCEVHEDAKITASDAATFDFFGGSVSVSGDVAVVGAVLDDCAAGSDCGSAYVYRFNGSTWVEEQKLTASDSAAYESFGASVSVSGNTVVVAAPDDACAAGDYCGAAYVYRFNPGAPGGPVWVEEAKLTASDADAGDNFGYSASVSGDVAVVGAVFDDCAAGIDCGSAYVYRFDGSTWVEEQKLTASDAGADESFGASVSVGGNTIVIAAPEEACTTGDYCGAAYVYRFNPGAPGGPVWVEEAKLTASDAAMNNYFGRSVSVSGNTAVVGADGDDCAGGLKCGSAYVYQFNGNTWVQQSKLTASDAATNDNFGRSVSVDGDVAIVGAIYDDCTAGFLCGSVYVFVKPVGGWTDSTETAKLTASDAAGGDHFGSSVSINGDVAVVGALFDDCGGGSYCGSAYVYALREPLCDCNNNGISDDSDIRSGTSRDCNNNKIPDECDMSTGASQDCNSNTTPDECDIASELSPDCNGNRIPDECDIASGLSPDCNGNRIPDECEFHEEVKWTAPDAAQGDQFGESVSISGDTAVVGHQNDDCAAGFLCGSAYVYRFNGSTWVQQAKLTASDADSLNLFGNSVSVSGNIVVVGAWFDDCDAGIACGSAYVYRFNPSTPGQWVEEAKLTASDADWINLFGYSVSVSGDTAVVGAPFDDCGAGVACGSAYVYRFNPGAPGQWIQEANLTASDAEEADLFGWSVSISGDVAVVGSWIDYCEAGASCGSAYIYRFNGSTWVEEAKLTASDADTGDNFGYSVSVSGDVAVVGARSDQCTAGYDCGSAYVYRFNGSTWVQESKLTASDAAQQDFFGYSVSVSGNTAIVGSWGDACGAGVACGSAYAYRFNGSSWVELAKLTASDAAEGDLFGVSVSVDGEVAVVGAINDDCTAGLLCGSAYMFTLPSDCNTNGITDECDIASGTSFDCNANGIPDECELNQDCNHNGVQDICDIAACAGDRACNDCNFDGVPDGCDIAFGTSQDCNTNGIPDECDIRAGVSRDTDGNGIPDECQAGACCDHDPFGGCTDGLTQSECICPRCEWSEGVLCDDLVCPRDSIPTVSTWGLAILSLLLLTGVKIRFGRIC